LSFGFHWGLSVSKITEKVKDKIYRVFALWRQDPRWRISVILDYEIFGRERLGTRNISVDLDPYFTQATGGSQHFSLFYLFIYCDKHFHSVRPIALISYFKFVLFICYYCH